MIKNILTGNSLFIKNLLLTSVFGGLIGALNYAFNIFVARFTTLEIFGIYGAVLGIIYLIQIPALSIQALVTKVVAKEKSFNLNSYKWSILLQFTALGIVFGFLFLLFKKNISNIATIPSDLIIYLAITFVLAFVSPISKGLLLGKERIFTVNLLLFLETILRFGIGYFAIKTNAPLPLLILSCAIPSVITTLVALPLINLKGDGEKKSIPIDLKELFLATVSFLLLTIPYTLDLILVNPEFRAQYSGVSLLGKLVYFAAITIASVMFARLSNLTKKAEITKSLLVALSLSVIIGLGTTAVLVVFKDSIISLTIGDKYLEVAPYLWIFGLCMTGYALVYMVANYFITQRYYVYIFVLLVCSVLQVYLFSIRNESLEMVVVNQVIVYLVLTLGTFAMLTLNLRRKG
ncbi:MAG: Capsular polysaccharide biosynthesis protein [candidate division WS6 bacterium GW2011_GWF1_35_23]|uniref:Capsular polysaccharide biosynthesis protein n=2 Tax=Candidatus Dojkabacteria TaxID=74243 RepID=A0A0G0ERT5_9BACT|nr:MAG: Capsular polysaccharide biosynthesis protein [candidate division WS6 bacterium GW2011_GWF1_35_23]